MRVSVTTTVKKRSRASVQQMIRRSLTQGAEEIATKAHATALDLTRGQISEYELRTVYHHPFSRRHPGTLPRLPINIQSRTQAGDASPDSLHKSFQVEIQVSSQKATVRLFNTSAHRIVLKRGGTQKMVDRGFWKALKKAVEPTFARAKQRLQFKKR